jgi:hypothetical protein
MSRPILSMAAVSIAVLLAATTWAQVGPPGGGGTGEGANPVPPSGAATVRTPGTPGAADTPGALLTNPSNNPPKVSSSPAPKSKKPTSSNSQSSAPAADTSGNSPGAPSK